MEASKLRNIIIDLDYDSNKLTTEMLSTLVSNINSNQTAEITTNLEKIKSSFKKSIVNGYTPSNFQILESIGALDYFGQTGLNKIEAILNENSYDIQKTVSDLNAYVENRNKFVSLIKSTDLNLDSLNIDAHFYGDNTFEIGLLMPEELTGNKIVNITKELNRWDKIFKTLKELIGNSPDDTEIDFINNGSHQFFIENGPQIATFLAITLERIVKLYKNIIDIRAAKDKLKELGVSKSEQKNVDKQEKEFFNKEIDKISLDLVKEFAVKEIETGRINELKISMKGHVLYIAKSIDKGLTIEINPPEITAPALSKDTDSEDKKAETKELRSNYERTLKQIEIVQKSMDVVKTIGKTGVDLVKLITSSEEGTDEAAADEEETAE